MSETILVVDDNEDTLKIVGKILAVERYRVKTAKDGQEALRSIDNETPALILLDIMIPKIDGFEAKQHFWQCPGCQAWDSYPPRRVEEL